MNKLAVTLMGILALSAGCKESHKTDQKNIIFLLADDMRYDAMGCAGNPVMKTPNIDRLAAEGVRFPNAFVTTSICCVSRASIFSGQYERRHGIYDFVTSLPDSAWAETYPALLKKAGYKTGFIGKFGVGEEKDMPKSTFDYWKGFGGQGKYEQTDSAGNYIHLTELMGNQAVEFISESAGKGPFCLSLSFKAPHCQDGDPRQFIYDPKHADLFSDVFIPEKETNQERYFLQFPEIWRANNEARARWEIRFSTPEKYQEMVKAYYTLIYELDLVVGRVRKELEKQGVADNTVIIFSSDNGFYLGEHGLAGKWYGHEESVRVPLILYDPGSEIKGSVIPRMALNIDIGPTILDYAGLALPPGMQGVSLKRLPEADTVGWRNEFFYEHPILKRQETVIIPGSEGVINDKYKLIRYYHNDSGFIYEELFDRKKDKLEIYNRFGDPSFSDLKKELEGKINSFKEELK